MFEAEKAAYHNALVRLRKSILVTTRFTAARICYLHKVFLGRIYPWAGRYRNVGLESVNGPPWPPPGEIPRLMAEYQRRVLRHLTPGRPMPRADLARNLAIIHGDLALIHPFRDGNGRTARLLVDLVAAQAGEPTLNWAASVKDNRRYYAAIGRVFDRDFGPLTELTLKAIEDAMPDADS